MDIEKDKKKSGKFCKILNNIFFKIVHDNNTCTCNCDINERLWTIKNLCECKRAKSWLIKNKMLKQNMRETLYPYNTAKKTLMPAECWNLGLWLCGGRFGKKYATISFNYWVICEFYDKMWLVGCRASSNFYQLGSCLSTSSCLRPVLNIFRQLFFIIAWGKTEFCFLSMQCWDEIKQQILIGRGRWNFVTAKCDCAAVTQTKNWGSQPEGEGGKEELMREWKKTWRWTDR